MLLPFSPSIFIACVCSINWDYFPSHLAAASSGSWIICCTMDQLLPCVQVCNCNPWLSGCCVKVASIKPFDSFSKWNFHKPRECLLYFYVNVISVRQLTCKSFSTSVIQRLPGSCHLNAMLLNIGWWALLYLTMFFAYQKVMRSSLISEPKGHAGVVEGQKQQQRRLVQHITFKVQLEVLNLK